MEGERENRKAGEEEGWKARECIDPLNFILCTTYLSTYNLLFMCDRMLLTVLNWAVWLLSWPAGLLGWSLLLVMTLRAVLGPEAAGSLHGRLLAWVMSRFLAQQEAHLDPIKADLFRPMAELSSARPELTGGALDILEVRRTPHSVTSLSNSLCL